MSIVIPKDQIDKATSVKVSRELTFTAKENHFSSSAKKIQAYKSADNNYHIPYSYGRLMFPSLKIEGKRKIDIRRTKASRANQEEIITNSVKMLRKYGSIQLVCYTGYGKTFCGTNIAAELGQLTLVLCTGVVLKEPWAGAFNKYTDADNVVIYSAKAKITENTQVIIAMIGDIPKMENTEWFSKIGTLIIDEAHTYCTAKRVSNLLSITPKYVIGLTATADNTQGLYGVVDSICSSRKVLVEDDRPISVFKYETPYIPKVHTTNWSEFIKDITLSDEALEHTMDVIRTVVKKGDKMFLFCSIIEQTDIIYAKCNSEGISAALMVGNVKDYNESSVLIATWGKLGVGYDEESYFEALGKKHSGLKARVVVFTFSIKTPVGLIQSVGRSRHHHPQVIHIVHNSKKMKEHFRENCKLYYNIRIAASIKTSKSMKRRLTISGVSQEDAFKIECGGMYECDNIDDLREKMGKYSYDRTTDTLWMY